MLVASEKTWAVTAPEVELFQLVQHNFMIIMIITMKKVVMVIITNYPYGQITWWSIIGKDKEGDEKSETMGARWETVGIQGSWVRS